MEDHSNPKSMSVNSARSPRGAFLLYEFPNGMRLFQIRQPDEVNRAHHEKYLYATLNIAGDRERIVRCILHAPGPKKTIDGREEMFYVFLLVCEPGITEEEMLLLKSIEIGDMLTVHEYEVVATQIKTMLGSADRIIYPTAA
jgi:hypothetical protein